MSDYVSLKDRGYVTVVCRICGQEWLYPPEMAKQFDSEHGLECSYCKNKLKQFKEVI